VGIDPAHASFLHRFFFDESLEESYGRQFRGASLGELDGQRLPMTKVMREFDQPDISFAPMPYGLQLTSLRPINDQITHTRVTNAIFPSTFVIPLSETMTITQIHVPVDDTKNYWYAIFTSFDAPVDKEVMRNQRLEAVTLPDYIPKSGQHNNWGFSADEQQSRTYLGMGESDINVHDQWACESMGAIQGPHARAPGHDRQGHHGQPPQPAQSHRDGAGRWHAAGRGRFGNRRAPHGPRHGGRPGPTGGTEAWWRHAVQAKRDNAPWDAALKPVAEPLAAEYSPHEEAS
jgi:phthalate 4,5-dioxygenase oxygenase subunit